MKSVSLLLASVATLFCAACSGEKAAEAKNAPEVTPTAVPAPNMGDWSTVVTKTLEGGYVMGNPGAKVKLVEYGSMTCPHCAEFEEVGGKALVNNYVKKGLVSWEFRNFVKDPFDMTTALLARCGGEASFFGMTRALYHDQRVWIGKIQAADPAQMQGLQTMTAAQQFSTIAEMAGLKTFVAQRGVPRAKAEQCLANEVDANQLVQMNSDAVSTYSVRGTPNFMINGTTPAFPASWETLEPKIKEALAS